VALVVAVLLGGVGGAWYFLSLPEGIALLSSVDVLVRDALAMLSGLSVLQITNAGQWALAAAPGPVFLTWYLRGRRRYAASALVGGAFLGVFVLTGDADTATTLFGAVGAAAAVGFGELDRREGRPADAEVVAVVIAAMVVLTLTVGVLPTGAQRTLSPGSTSAPTVEGSLVETQDRVQIQGAISLSPKVRFTVESEAPEYWKVASYDRYAGDTWIRTGGNRPYEGRLSGPEGPDQSVVQRYRVESEVETMPAAWKPVEVATDGFGTQVTRSGTLDPNEPLEPGDSYRVESRVPVSDPVEIRQAGTDYPEAVEERYPQLPSSTPDRVGERTERITANADNPYDTARVIERWLENNRNYSLDVQKPDGNVADAFLFEMDRGYCVYYATTMVTMLRTQGIPARFVVGYTPGQQVDDDRYVVRGLDSHAWVEVYFPGHGWSRFDPTPATPREQAEQQRLEQARAENERNVDTQNSEATPTPTPTPTGASTPGTNGTNATAVETVTATVQDPFGPGATGGAGGSGGPQLPSRREVGLGLIVAAGAAAGLRRTGTARRVYRELWLRRLPDGPPERRVTGAYERLEYLLERRARERRAGETPRQYLAAVTSDERARRLGGLYERAVYAGAAGTEEAAEAARLLEELVDERPVRERIRR
jgi:transglutaminase-like putative cysteine protease